MSKPAVRGEAFTFNIALSQQADPKLFQANPTLASGDVTVIKDGGTPANIGSLPTAVSSGAVLEVALTSSEMDADRVVVLFEDAAGAQWCSLSVTIRPDGTILTSAVNDASATTTSFVTDLTSSTDDVYNDLFLVFTDGTHRGVSRKISDYNGTTKAITLATALTSAPADNDPFIILGRSE